MANLILIGRFSKETLGWTKMPIWDCVCVCVCVCVGGGGGDYVSKESLEDLSEQLSILYTPDQWTKVAKLFFAEVWAKFNPDRQRAST